MYDARMIIDHSPQRAENVVERRAMIFPAVGGDQNHPRGRLGGIRLLPGSKRVFKVGSDQWCGSFMAINSASVTVLPVTKIFSRSIFSFSRFSLA